MWQELVKLLLKESYHLGLIYEPNLQDKNLFSKIRWINEGKFKNDGWLADPFILEENENNIIILAEQLFKNTNLGRLVKVVVNKETLKITEIKNILQINSHLSFPHIVRSNNKIYVCPENYQNGSLRIWEYNTTHEELQNPITLINEPLLDAQFLKDKDWYYILATRFTVGNLSDTKNLYVYKSKKLTGPYTLFQVIKDKENVKRGAGEILFYENKILRPAQSCKKRYGESLIFYELNVGENSVQEKLINEIKPDARHKYGNALHTYNQFNKWAILDGQGYDYPFLAKLYIYMSKFKSRLLR